MVVEGPRLGSKRERGGCFDWDFHRPMKRRRLEQKEDCSEEESDMESLVGLQFLDEESDEGSLVGLYHLSDDEDEGETGVLLELEEDLCLATREAQPVVGDGVLLELEEDLGSHYDSNGVRSSQRVRIREGRVLGSFFVGSLRRSRRLAKK